LTSRMTCRSTSSAATGCIVRTCMEPISGATPSCYLVSMLLSAQAGCSAQLGIRKQH
jgi:hypothetical protein